MPRSDPIEPRFKIITDATDVIERMATVTLTNQIHLEKGEEDVPAEIDLEGIARLRGERDVGIVLGRTIVL